MIDTCETLAAHVRESLTPSSGLTGLKAHETHGFVSFRWYDRDFVVKKSMEVFEVKGQNLFVTGGSILLQAVLAKADYDPKIVETLVSSIRQVEDLIADDDQRDSGFKLLSTVRDTLKKLSRQKVESHHPSLASAKNLSSGNGAPGSTGQVEPAVAT